MDRYKDNNEGEDNGYIFFLVVTLFSPLQKELNRRKNLEEGTISLSHFVYISKIG